MPDKVIALVCSAAMSSSLVAQKMQKAADASGKQYQIYSRSIDDVDNLLRADPKPNIILVSPQVRFRLAEVSAKGATAGVPVDIIAPQNYAMYPDRILAEAEKKMS